MHSLPGIPPAALLAGHCLLFPVFAQTEGFPPGFPPAGPGGSLGPPMQQERKLVSQFDRDGNKRLGAEERAAAREFLRSDGASPRQRPDGPGGRLPGQGGRSTTAPEPGVKLTPGEVAHCGTEPLYDPGTLRTVFLEFENADWERELEDFRDTDVEVPATRTVDRKQYREVGVRFRGASSCFMVPTGYKRSLNLPLDQAPPAPPPPASNYGGGK